MKFLGLDVGEKRIGVARGDDNTRIAIPVGYVETGGGEWQEIARIANFYGINRFIVGLPRNNQGQETAQSAYVREWVRQLVRQIPGVLVKLQDETLTSVVAEERLKQSGKPYQKGDIDAEAATIILQDFLEGTRNVENRQISPVEPPKTNEVTNIEEEPKMSKKRQKEAKKAEKAAKKQQKADKTGKKDKKSKSGVSPLSIISGVLILALIGGAGVAGLLYVRDQRRAARQAEYAAQEAAMEAEVFEFTVRPGETISDVRNNLVAVGYSPEEVDEAFEAKYDFPMLNDPDRGDSLEGYLFGETKEFYQSTPATEVIRFYLQEMQNTINENKLKAKFAEQGLSLFEGITLASVVQKEANPADMPTVAQVFLTRLNEGMTLGSDVTVSYVLDNLDPERDSFSDNQAALGVESCYNTRLYTGLPCGAISNPGLSALLAVANPSDTSYLYFLTGDDGLMYYSYTEDEHTLNAQEHCQDLCQVSL